MKKNLLLLLLLGSLNLMSQNDLIISEYVEGYSTNKALELYNPTDKGINLKDYQIVRYSNGKNVPPVGTNNWKVALPDTTIAPYCTYVIVLDKRNPKGTDKEAPVWKNLQQRADIFLCPNYDVSNAMYFNGDDAVAIQKNDTTLIDLFGRWGPPRPAEAAMPKSNKKIRCWTDTKPHFDGKGIGITADHTLIKKSNIDEGVTSNPTIFNPLKDWDTLPANTFSNLGWHKYDKAPANETPVFEKEKYIFTLASTSENGAEVGKVKANDKEKDIIKYYIEYGNFVYIDEKRIEPFQLDKKTGLISLIDKAGIKPSVKDTFNLKIVATDGFSQSKEILAQVSITKGGTGVNDKDIKEKIMLYPNPTLNKQFAVEASQKIKHISVMNIIGKVLYSNDLNANKTSVYLPKGVSGVYFVNVILQDGTKKTIKLLLQ